MFPCKLNDKYLKLSSSTRAISASSETSNTSGSVFVLNFTWPMRLLIQIHSFHSSSLPDYFPRSLARSHLVDYYFLSLLSSYI